MRRRSPPGTPTPCGSRSTRTAGWASTGSRTATREPNRNLTETGYRQAIESYVSDLNAHGLYAILDLHWTAPGNQVALEQQPMPDADHSPAFWESVATTFKGNPAVVFDIFNEPYDPTDPPRAPTRTPQDKVSWNCWETGTESGPAGGAPCDTAAYDANEVADDDLSGGGHADTGRRDPHHRRDAADHGRRPELLQRPQPVGDTRARRSAQPGGGLVSQLHGPELRQRRLLGSQVAPVAANVPVVTGEFDEDNYLESKCAVQPPTGFDSEYMNWADHTASVTWPGAGWCSPRPRGTPKGAVPTTYRRYVGTPAAPNGTTLHDHLLSAPAGRPATTPVTPPPREPARARQRGRAAGGAEDPQGGRPAGADAAPSPCARRRAAAGNLTGDHQHIRGSAERTSAATYRWARSIRTEGGSTKQSC